MTETKALGLLTLLMTDSQLSRDLNAKLKQPGVTRDHVWTFFKDSVAPFGVSSADLDRTKIEPLWYSGGVLKPKFESHHTNVGAALNPPLEYSPGPCPKGVIQTEFMNKLP